MTKTKRRTSVRKKKGTKAKKRSVRRRGYEYDHKYGLALQRRAMPPKGR
ncbi:MAG: hypothetical protein WAK90_19905 [Pseudolabrys sp.]